MFRERRRSCPGCNASMDEIPVPLVQGQSAQIDHCTACGGVFLEFFDGDPVDLSGGTLEQLARAAAPAARYADVRCPDCEAAMPLLRYLEQGPWVYRCEACLGIFVSRAQLRELADYVEPEAPEESPSLLQRLRRLFETGTP